MGRLTDLIEARFGIATEPRESVAGEQVGTAVEAILRNDPDRLAAIIINLSANVIWISPDRDVTSTHGLRLGPNGGSYTLIWDEEFELTGYEWFAVADAAASDVYTLEVIGR